MSEYEFARRAALQRTREASVNARTAEAAYARGFSEGWVLGVNWSAGAAYEAGRSDAEDERDSSYESGVEAGRIERREDQDAIYRSGYMDGLADNRAVVGKLKARLMQCGEAAT